MNGRSRALALRWFDEVWNRQLAATVDELLAPEAVVRWRAAGTHLGEGFGIRATRTAVAFRGMTWQRIVDGRIVEGWDAWNQGALVESLRAAAEL